MSEEIPADATKTKEAPVDVKDAFVLSAYEASGLPGIQTLLEEWGAQLLNHVHTQYGKTALILASMRNNLESVRLLIQSGAAVDFVDSYGWTALREAAYNGNVDTFKFLMEQGADYAAKDDQGRDALACAILGAKPEMESCIRSLPSV
jgi:ankyrin repeat protein